MRLVTRRAVRAVQADRSGRWDDRLVGLADDRRTSAVPVVRTPHDERDGQFSPDGKWIAYESDEAGSREIYIQPFPGPGPKVGVSINGGTQVRWRRDGKRGVLIAPDESLMSVPIQAGVGPFDVGAPAPLFKTRIAPIRSIRGNSTSCLPTGSGS